MLVKLLAQTPHTTPTLPTSIATSNYDKLAKENKENPNKPRVATGLVETLLNRNRTSSAGGAQLSAGINTRASPSSMSAYLPNMPDQMSVNQIAQPIGPAGQLPSFGHLQSRPKLPSYNDLDFTVQQQLQQPRQAAYGMNNQSIGQQQLYWGSNFPPNQQQMGVSYNSDYGSSMLEMGPYMNRNSGDFRYSQQNQLYQNASAGNVIRQQQFEAAQQLLPAAPGQFPAAGLQNQRMSGPHCGFAEPLSPFPGGRRDGSTNGNIKNALDASSVRHQLLMQQNLKRSRSGAEMQSDIFDFPVLSYGHF